MEPITDLTSLSDGLRACSGFYSLFLIFFPIYEIQKKQFRDHRPHKLIHPIFSVILSVQAITFSYTLMIVAVKSRSTMKTYILQRLIIVMDS